MMPRIVMALWLVGSLAAAGCGASPPSRFYTLDAVAPPSTAPAARYAVIVGPVSVPASVDRPEFVVQVAPNQVRLDEFNRWAAPLSDSIARTVAGDLAQLLASPDVATAPLAHFKPAYRVTISVQRFDSIDGQAAVLDAVWVVHQAASGRTDSGHTLAREAVQGTGFDALAAAHSRALATLSADVAAAIRAQPQVSPSASSR